MISPQKNLYEKIHDEYSLHFYDYWSTKYREFFIYKELFKGFNFDNTRIIELACGEGHAADYIKNKFKHATIEGIDISEKAIKIFEKKHNFKGYNIDITKKFSLNNKYDYAIIYGALHLCVNDLSKTIENISNLLKKDGILFLFEPNSNSIFEPMRKFWYKKDKYFVTNNINSLDHDKISSLNPNFTPIFLKYMGGPGYIFICNSLILRMPKFLKHIISPFLIFMEIFWNLLPKKFTVTFAARWKKIY
tara:strand:+ start:2459 stop:3202 length:744 start_codon:yes stop_codon:yes gene_type:complete